MLLTVLVMVFLVLLALSVAAPKVAKEIQRDKEQEALQRGLQYRRAIQLYYKKFGAYPTDIKQLEKTNEIRFLRKRYTDPITGKDDWRLIHMGEAKVPPLGFFGQPLQSGMSSVSTGPGSRAASTLRPTRTALVARMDLPAGRMVCRMEPRLEVGRRLLEAARASAFRTAVPAMDRLAGLARRGAALDLPVAGLASRTATLDLPALAGWVRHPRERMGRARAAADRPSAAPAPSSEWGFQ